MEPVKLIVVLLLAQNPNLQFGLCPEIRANDGNIDCRYIKHMITSLALIEADKTDLSFT